MATVEALRVDAVQPVDPARERRLSRIDDCVVVRAHQAEGVTAPAESSDRRCEKPDERSVVGVVDKELRIGNAVRCQEESAGRKLAASHPRHGVDINPPHPATSMPPRRRFRVVAKTLVTDVWGQTQRSGWEGQTLTNPGAVGFALNRSTRW
jgi:hypothetical protein